MNRNYCKVIEDGASVEYAPSFFAPNPAEPTAAEYLAHGWLHNRIENANPPEGYMVTATRYEAQGDGVVAAYEYAPIPKVPRRWSRLTLKTGIANRGWMPQMRQILGGIEIAPDYTAWEALTDCNYIEEGYPDAVTWDATLNAVAAAIGKTRADIDAFLESLETENAE